MTLFISHFGYHSLLFFFPLQNKEFDKQTLDFSSELNKICLFLYEQRMKPTNLACSESQLDYYHVKIEFQSTLGEIRILISNSGIPNSTGF